MELKEIVDKFSGLTVCECRHACDDYSEVVFYHKDFAQWNELFVGLLGPALKPAGTRATSEDLRLTENYGGIRGDQTLFKKDFGDYIIVAMFWPWQDTTHITLKLAFLKK